MKKLLLLTFMAAFSLMAYSQTKILLTVGANSMTATLVDNEATRELKAMLENGPVTITMSDYGGFEKVGELPHSLSTSNTQITTVPGDIMLYQGNNMVIFYGSNSWSYTRLGKIDNATVPTLKQFLGTVNISLSISLDASGSIDDLYADKDSQEVIFDLRGNRVTEKPLPAGIYIINGRKRVIKDNN